MGVRLCDLLSAGAQPSQGDRKDDKPMALPPRNALQMAAAHGNTRWVESFKENGVPLDLGRESGATASYTAVVFGQLDFLRALHAAGDDLQAYRNPLNGGNLLDVAIQHGQVCIARELLDFGFDINKPNSRGLAPLHEAITNPAMLRCMIEKGADLDQTWNGGDTAIGDCVATQNLQGYMILLQAGASLSILGDDGGRLRERMEAFGDEWIDFTRIVLAARAARLAIAESDASGSPHPGQKGV